MPQRSACKKRTCTNDPAYYFWSLHNRLLVLLMAALLSAWGIYAFRHTPLDAIPDLSDAQVIIKTAYPGQSPQAVEDQVTYRLPRHCCRCRARPPCAAFHVRRVVHLHHLQRRYRSLLGALARARISEPDGGQVADRRHPGAGAGRIRRGLGVRVRAGRPPAPPRPGPVARLAGFLPEVRIAKHPRRVRSGERRRHGAAIPDRGRARTGWPPINSPWTRWSRRCATAIYRAVAPWWKLGAPNI